MGNLKTIHFIFPYDTVRDVYEKKWNIDFIFLYSIERKMKKVLGKKHVCKLSSLRSGLLLVEVDQKQLYDRLMTTKKLDDIPVIIEEHTGLNTSKGIVFCDSEAIGRMSNEEIKSEMESQNVTEVYRVIQKREGEEDKATNMYIITFSSQNKC